MSLGRKWGMHIGSLIVIIFTIVQATSLNLAQFMIGRFMLGFGVAICASAGPTYVIEMAHPSYRGVMTALYNSFWYVGAIPGTFVPYGTSIIGDSRAWRIPIWMQLVFASLVAICSPFLPETPRWLIANKRYKDALNVMVGTCISL
jgi:MFS family permease